MLNRTTRKRYYEDAYLGASTASVVRVGADYLELDATVAFPEGGGQEADHGVITVDGMALRFIDAKKMYGMPLNSKELPDINVGGVIWHMIAPEDQKHLAKSRESAPACVEIDVTRRAWLSLSHTASHLLYLGVGAYRPDAIGATLGCHIKTEAARFDFSVERRFEPDEIASITDFANSLVRRALPIDVYAHATHPDARFWRCDDQVIPCGGMHLANTSAVGELRVRRKNLGTGKERLSCEFPFAVIDVSGYRRNAAECQ